MRRTCLPFLLLVAALQSPAAASPERLMVNLWRPEPATGAIGTTTVRRGEAAFRQRLLPTGLRIADGDVVDSRTRAMLVPGGSELFELAGENEQAWCDAAPPGGARRPSAPRRGPPTHTCLLDVDRDGRFESSFSIAGTSWALPTIFARRPSRVRPLAAPVPYREVAPAEFRANYHVSLIYYGGRPLGGRVFELIAGIGELQDPIAGAVVVGTSELPRSFERRGARFTVLALNEGGATLQVHSAVPATPLSAIRTLQISP